MDSMDDVPVVSFRVMVVDTARNLGTWASFLMDCNYHYVQNLAQSIAVATTHYIATQDVHDG
jgi:hypothetical protein